MGDNRSSSDEKSKMSVEEIKSLMVEGKLPEECISEKNVLTLLSYEVERMRIIGSEQIQTGEFCDLSIIIYCIDILVRRCHGGGEVVNKWDRELAKIKGSLREIDRNSEEVASEFIKKMFETLGPQMRADEEQLRKSAKKFEKLLEEAEKRRRHNKLRFTVKKHVVAFMIACVLMLPVALIAFNTNVFGDIADFTQDMFQSIRGNEVREDDRVRIGLDTGVYSSIEEFEVSRGVNLMVPRWLPRDLEIENITHTEAGLNITYTDGVTILRIDFNKNMPFNIGDTAIYEYKGIMFYLFRDVRMILWEHNGDFYHFDFGFDISEYAHSVIENIK